MIGCFKLQLWKWLVDLNYNFECDWLIELSDNKLSDNKLSDNNLASELVSNKSFKTNHNRGNCNFYDKLGYMIAIAAMKQCLGLLTKTTSSTDISWINW